MEHGLISNVLPSLDLVDQLAISNICSRTHNVTVPWNIHNVALPQSTNFPKINDISGDFVCKRDKARLDGNEGYFCGSFCKTTNLPDGYGVFTTGDWIHCGKVKGGIFSDGRKVSVDGKEKFLKLVNTKNQPDGSVL